MRIEHMSTFKMSILRINKVKNEHFRNLHSLNEYFQQEHFQNAVAVAVAVDSQTHSQTDSQTQTPPLDTTHAACHTYIATPIFWDPFRWQPQVNEMDPHDDGGDQSKEFAQ